MPSTSDFHIRDDFPPVDYAEWQELVERNLGPAGFEALTTRIAEGISLEPIYAQESAPLSPIYDGLPGQPPFVRGTRPVTASGRSVDVRQEYSHPSATEINRQILDDLAGGATSIHIRLSDASSELGEIDDAEGALIFSKQQLATAVRSVDFTRSAVSLDAGGAFLPAAAFLISLWNEQSVDLKLVKGAFHADPFGVMARNGKLPMGLKEALIQLADLACWTDIYLPQVTSVGVSTLPYYRNGASEAQDLAFQMATGVEYLRCLTDWGLTIDQAAQQILFRVALGTWQYSAIAKLRAGRRLWSHIVQSCGGSAASGAMKVHAQPTLLTFTRDDSHNNIFRNTVGVFAAIVSGADVVTSVPFDILADSASDLGRRIARNTPIIIGEESRLYQPIDPAGGSWLVDSLTEEFCRKAWAIFQQIEKLGGMAQALQSGWLADEIGPSRAGQEIEDADILSRLHLAEFKQHYQRARQELEQIQKPIAKFAVVDGRSKTEQAIVWAQEGASIGQILTLLGERAGLS